MNWWKRDPGKGKRWPIEPDAVDFGSLAPFGKDASRQGVAVRYRGEAQARFIPLARFERETSSRLQQGRRLHIQELRVAPILKRRRADFFDRLTDWGPATTRALRRVDRAHERFRRALDSYS